MPMYITATLTPEDAKLAEQVNATRVRVGWVARLAIGSMSLAHSAVGVSLVGLLSCAFLFNLPQPLTAIKWSYVLVCTSLILNIVLPIANEAILKRYEIKQTIRFEVNDACLSATTAQWRTEYLWSGISSAETDQRRIYVTHEPSGVTVIPARCFENYAHFEAFYQALVSKLHEAQGHLTTPSSGHPSAAAHVER